MKFFDSAAPTPLAGLAVSGCTKPVSAILTRRATLVWTMGDLTDTAMAVL